MTVIKVPSCKITIVLILIAGSNGKMKKVGKTEKGTVIIVPSKSEELWFTKNVADVNGN